MQVPYTAYEQGRLVFKTANIPVLPVNGDPQLAIQYTPEAKRMAARLLAEANGGVKSKAELIGDVEIQVKVNGGMGKALVFAGLDIAGYLYDEQSSTSVVDYHFDVTLGGDSVRIWYYGDQAACAKLIAPACAKLERMLAAMDALVAAGLGAHISLMADVMEVGEEVALLSAINTAGVVSGELKIFSKFDVLRYYYSTYGSAGYDLTTDTTTVTVQYFATPADRAADPPVHTSATPAVKLFYYGNAANCALHIDAVRGFLQDLFVPFGLMVEAGDPFLGFVLKGVANSLVSGNHALCYVIFAADGSGTWTGEAHVVEGRQTASAFLPVSYILTRDVKTWPFRFDNKYAASEIPIKRGEDVIFRLSARTAIHGLRFEGNRLWMVFSELGADSAAPAKTLKVYAYTPKNRRGVRRDEAAKQLPVYTKADTFDAVYLSDGFVWTVQGVPATGYQPPDFYYSDSASSAVPVNVRQYVLKTGALSAAYAVADGRHLLPYATAGFAGAETDDTYLYWYGHGHVKRVRLSDGALMAEASGIDVYDIPRGVDYTTPEKTVSMRLCGDFLFLTDMRAGLYTEGGFSVISVPAGYDIEGHEFEIIPQYRLLVLDKVTLEVVFSTYYQFFGAVLAVQHGRLKKGVPGRVKMIGQAEYTKSTLDTANVVNLMLMTETTIHYDGHGFWFDPIPLDKLSDLPPLAHDPGFPITANPNANLGAFIDVSYKVSQKVAA